MITETVLPSNLPNSTLYNIGDLKIFLHHEDLALSVLDTLRHPISVDTELNRILDYKIGKLCLIQIKGKDSDVRHLVKFDVDKPHNSPVLKQMFENDDIPKIFHYGRVDLHFISDKLQCTPVNILCTKVASKIVRGQADNIKHNLHILCDELLSIKLDKGEQMSKWENKILTPSQKFYAALDVEYLDDIFNILINREPNLYDLIMQNCRFYETLIKNDLSGKDPLDDIPEGLILENQKHGIDLSTLFEH